jgi:hypothetical protein
MRKIRIESTEGKAELQRAPILEAEQLITDCYFG